MLQYIQSFMTQNYIYIIGFLVIVLSTYIIYYNMNKYNKKETFESMVSLSDRELAESILNYFKENHNEGYQSIIFYIHFYNFD